MFASKGRYVSRWVVLLAAGATTVAAAALPGASASAGGVEPGTQMWISQYDNGNDHAYSMVASPSGKTVFVTGSSDGNSTGLDYATVAYDAASGEQLWSARYNGVGSGDDTARSVAVSPDGRTVFVTGSSYGGATGLDYATVAYDAASGEQLWVARYTGTGSGSDNASQVVVSPGGRTVSVTGSSYLGSSGIDYVTVSYDVTSGAEQWVSSYNGPGNGNDYASSMAVSPDARTVFVTGRSYGGSTGDDYATVAYNATSGEQLWQMRYNNESGNSTDAATSVAVSPRGGTVFVTGYSANSSAGDQTNDYQTLAYNAASGVVQWASRYNGPVNNRDEATSVAVSPNGKTVYVTGYSWHSSASTGDDYETIAYSAASGEQLWQMRYNGDDNLSDGARQVAVSPNGKTVYVTGLINYNRSAAAGADYGTVAYNAASGEQLWVAIYNGPAGGNADAHAVAVSPNGKTVYVAGSSGIGNAYDYVTIAYHS